MEETPRNKWIYPEWNADWQVWQQKFKDLIQNQDASVFGNIEGRTYVFKALPNAEIIDEAGYKKLKIYADLQVVSRTFNTAIHIKCDVPIKLKANYIIGAVVTKGAVQEQDTELELYSEVDITPNIQIFGYIDDSLFVNWFNGTTLKFGEQVRPIFSGIDAGSIAGTDKVRISSSDTTGNFLSSKLVEGDNITLTVGNVGGNEYIEISTVGNDNTVKVTDDDEMPDYLSDKIKGGAGVKIEVRGSAGYRTLNVEYGDANTIMVDRGASDFEAGANLLSTYAHVKTLSPAANNRYKILLLSGRYLINSQLVLDTPYIDFICDQEAFRVDTTLLPNFERDVVLAGATIKPNTAFGKGTVLLTADNVIMRGINIAGYDNGSTIKCYSLDVEISTPVDVGGVDRWAWNSGFIGCTLMEGGNFTSYMKTNFSGFLINTHVNGWFFGMPEETTLLVPIPEFDGYAYGCSAQGAILSGVLGEHGIIDNCTGTSFSFGSIPTNGLIKGIVKNCYGFGSVFGEYMGSTGVVDNCRAYGNPIFGFCYTGSDSGAVLKNCNIDNLGMALGSIKGWNGRIENCNIRAGGSGARVVVLGDKNTARIINSSLSSASDESASISPDYCSVMKFSSITGVVDCEIKGCYLGRGIASEVKNTALWSGNTGFPNMIGSVIELPDLHDPEQNALAFKRALQFVNMMKTEEGVIPEPRPRRVIKLAPAKYDFTNVMIDTEVYWLKSVDIVGHGDAYKLNWDDRYKTRDEIIAPVTQLYVSYTNGWIFSLAKETWDVHFYNLHLYSPNGAPVYMGSEYPLETPTGGRSACTFKNCVFETTRSEVNITAISKGNQPIVTVEERYYSGGMTLGDLYLHDIGGMTELKDGWYKINYLDDSRFVLIDVDSTNYTDYTSGGKVVKNGMALQNSALLSSADALIGDYINCHFIGCVNDSWKKTNAMFKHCSFTDESIVSNMTDCYVDNCRFTCNSLCVSSSCHCGYDEDDRVIIKNTKLWGAMGLGCFALTFYPYLENIVFFGNHGLGVLPLRGQSKPYMKNVTAKNLYVPFVVSSGAIIENCHFEKDDNHSGGYDSAVLSVSDYTFRVVSFIQQTPPSSTHAGIVEIETDSGGVDVSFNVGDEIVFSASVTSVGFELDGKMFIIKEIVNSTHFRIEYVIADSEWQALYDGWGSVGRSRVTIKDTFFKGHSVYEPASQLVSLPTLQCLGPGPAGLTITGCTCLDVEKFYGWDASTFVLLDCSSDNNDTIFPHMRDSVVRLDKHMRMNPVDNGYLLQVAFWFIKQMRPDQRFFRDARDRVTLQLGRGTYFLEKNSDLDGYIYIDGTMNNIIVQGIGHVSYETPVRGELPATLKDVNGLVEPETTIITKGSMFVLGYTCENISIRRLRLLNNMNYVGYGKIISANTSDVKNIEISDCILTSDARAIYNITNITQANPAVVTVAGGVSIDNDTTVYIDNVTGMPEIENRHYIVANRTATTFELKGVDSTTFSAYTSGGNFEVRKTLLDLRSARDLSLKNTIVDGLYDQDSLTQGVIDNCLFFDKTSITHMDLSTISNSFFMGSGFLISEGLVMGETSVIKDSYFLFAAIKKITPSAIEVYMFGLLDNVIFEEEACCDNAELSGRMHNVKMYNMTNAPIKVKTEGIVENIEIFMYVNATPLLVAPAAVVRQAVVKDLLSKMTSAFSIGNDGTSSGNGAYISYSELKNGIDSAVVNVLSPDYNITT